MLHQQLHSICEFFTSAKVHRGFRINQRIVMQSLGHGYAATEKLKTLMNIPKPKTVNNYNKTVWKIRYVVHFMLFIKGIEIKKFEYVRHYRKLVGTRLRNLKKKEKGLGQIWKGFSYRCHNQSTEKSWRWSYLSSCWLLEKYEIKFFSFLVSYCFRERQYVPLSTFSSWLKLLVQIQRW